MIDKKESLSCPSLANKEEPCHENYAGISNNCIAIINDELTPEAIQLISEKYHVLIRVYTDKAGHVCMKSEHIGREIILILLGSAYLSRNPLYLSGSTDLLHRLNKPIDPISSSLNNFLSSLLDTRTYTTRFAMQTKYSLGIEAYAPRTLDPHSSYYIPPYFSIFGSDRPLVTVPIQMSRCKVQKNIRPKGTHTHRKFYR